MFISEAISKEASFVEPNLLKKRKIASPDSKERNHQQQQMPPKTDREILEDKGNYLTIQLYSKLISSSNITFSFPSCFQWASQAFWWRELQFLQ